MDALYRFAYNVTDLQPALVFGRSSARAGETLELKCRIETKVKAGPQMHLYLCKDGALLQMERLRNAVDHTFILRNISDLDSGNYSCVFSFHKLRPKSLNTTGLNSIHISVYGHSSDVLPAEIYGSSEVKAGQDLELKCKIPTESGSFYMYLCKDSVLLKMRLLQDKKEETFILRNISEHDYGSYSCVYSNKKYALKDFTGTEQSAMKFHFYGMDIDGVLIFGCIIVIFDIKAKGRPVQYRLSPISPPAPST
ncbi:uncharacterized protein LOC103027644 [Astyanax mexicanus]|uniref:uncharacterized protein LOC103027644 n=1 Tax=Astyanax mexicanus TaxID=7994 RepID=UPI0020CB52DD|nr:uncharacterized protein LOC103027644 [Astyanax mexicanus]